VDLLYRGFARREGISLTEYAARSFGVFQEEPMDVVLRFAPEAAEDAAGWVFHPTQTMEPQADGSLIVRFHAGGVQEMCWHLFTWGTDVLVISPDSLRLALSRLALAAGTHHDRFGRGQLDENSNVGGNPCRPLCERRRTTNSRKHDSNLLSAFR
jgi:hypothetical protein